MAECTYTLTTASGEKTFDSEEALHTYVKDNLAQLSDAYDIPDTFEGQRDQFADRWNLAFTTKEGEPGFVTKNGKVPTHALISKMARQLADRSGPLYNKLTIRYNATYGLIQISARENPTGWDPSSPVYDITEGDTNPKQPRIFQQLSGDFRMHATDQTKYFLSAQSVKNDTYTSQGEYFNVDKQRTGNAQQLAKQLGVTPETLKERVKDSKVQPGFLNDFIGGKNTVKLTLYKVDRVTDPELFVNPNEDQTIGNLRKARVTQLTTLKQQINQEKDPVRRTQLYKERRRLESQIKDLNKPDNQNVGFLKKLFLDDKAAFEGREFTSVKDINRALNLFNGYDVLFKSLDLTPFGEQIVGEFAQHQVEIKQIMDSLAKLKNEVSLKQMELKAEATFADDSGQLLPVKDIQALAGYTLAMSTTQNNPLVRFIGRTTNFAVNKGQDKVVQKKQEIKKVVNELVKWGKGVGLKGHHLYDYMLEEEVGADGKMHHTGHFVIKHGRFYSNLAKTLKGKDEKANITNFMKYLRENTNKIEVKDQDFQEERKGIYDLATERIKAKDPTLNDQEVHALAEQETSRIAYGIDPQNFMSLVDKFYKGGKLDDKDTAFLRNFMDRRGYYKFIHLVPKDEFNDPKYATIDKMVDSDPRKQFYNLFTGLHYEARDGAAENSATLRRNFIAEYKRDYRDEDENIFDYLKDTAHDWVLHQLTESARDNIHEVDPLTKEITRSIPFYAFDGRIKPEDKNYNLGKVLGVLAQQYYHYEALSEVEDDLLMAQHLLQQTPVYQTNSFGAPITVNGEPVIKKDSSSMYKQADYHILSILYGEQMKKEGIVENPYYDAKTSRRIGELDEVAKTRELDTAEAEEYRQLKANSTSITAKKAANLLINWTSVKNIGFNVFGGAADFVRAMSSVYLRHGGKFWFNTLIPNTLTLFNPTDSAAKRKLNGLRRMFRIEADPNPNMESSTFKHVAYIAYHHARTIANTSYLLGVLKDQAVKDKQGKEHPLYDVMDFDQDGKVVMAPGFDNPFYDEKGQYTEYKYKLNQIVQKEIKMNRDREANVDPIQLNQVWWGRLLGQFKASWLFEGLATRLGSEHEGLNDLDRATKGIYRSFWDLAKVYTHTTNALGEVETRFSMLQTLLKATVNVAKYSIPGRLLGFGRKGDNQTALDYQGAIRTVREIQTVLFLYGMAIMISGLASGDSKGDWKKRGMVSLANFFMRSFRDVSTYGDPQSLASFITQGAIPSLGTITQMVKLIEDPFRGLGGNWYYNEGKKDQSVRIVRDGADLVPIMNQFRGTLNKTLKTQFNFY